jgi:hypothetical protein
MEASDVALVGLAEGLRAGVLAQEGSGALTLEGPHDLGELGKDEDQEPVELAQTISKILAQALVQAHELAELVEDRIGRRRGLRALLGAEPAMVSASVRSVFARRRSSCAKRRMRSGLMTAHRKSRAHR